MAFALIDLLNTNRVNAIRLYIFNPPTYYSIRGINYA